MPSSDFNTHGINPCTPLTSVAQVYMFFFANLLRAAANSSVKILVCQSLVQFLYSFLFSQGLLSRYHGAVKPTFLRLRITASKLAGISNRNEDSHFLSCHQCGVGNNAPGAPLLIRFHDVY